ncbi:MAG TPA: hypothetical protein VJP77_08185, partial [Planctomycetota bacterium]|nr:hypothetical protein [Planctomycetota bacterium]
ALGRLYGWNTLGAMAGTLCAATWLVRDLPLGLLAAALVNVPAAILAATLLERRRVLVLGVAGLAALVAYPAIGRPFIDVDHLLGVGVPRLLARGPVSTAMATGQLDWEGNASSPRERWDVGPNSLFVDGKVVASSAPIDLRLQRLLGAAPAFVHGDVGSALVIGLGTGMTAGVLLDLPGLERLEVVELSEAVVAVLPAFDAWNGELLGDPRTRLHVTDGRHFLRTTEARWDLITADPIHPWTRGSSDLFALEHFEAIREHLAPGGVASQWLPLYQLSLDDVRTVVATWCAAFPHASAWLTAYDLALVGSVAPLPGPAELAGRPLWPRLAERLGE